MSKKYSLNLKRIKSDGMERENYKIWHNLDIILAIIVLIAIILFPFFIHLQIIYMVPIITILFVTLTYLIVRNKMKTRWISNFEKLYSSYLNLRLLNILYMCFFIYSIFSLIGVNYTRPVTYFIAITLMVSVLTLEILFIPVKSNIVYLSLFKVALVAFNLRLGIQYLFHNSFVWYDPWYHKMFTESIISTGFVPDNLTYSSRPFMQIFFASQSIVTGINNIIMINSIVFTLKSLLIIILLFLIGWKLLNSKKIGLLSSLLYSVMDRAIIYDVSFSPTSLAILLLMMIIYILFLRDLKDKKITMTTLILLFMGTLILTHTLTSVLLLTVLFVILLTQKIFNYTNEKSIVRNLLILFSVSMFAYWMYAPDHFMTQFLNIIKRAFRTDIISSSMSFKTTSSYLSQIPIFEHILSYLGFCLFAGVSVLGSLYSFLNKNRYLLFFSISSIFIFIITFLGIVLRIHVLPDRWWYYSQHISPVIMISGMLSLCHGVIKNKKIGNLLIIIFLISISFFNITDPIANIDSPLYSRDLTVRHACTSSEIQSGHTISCIFYGKILTDVQYAVSYHGNNTIEIINESLITGKYYTIFNGLIILRKYILDGNPFDAKGLYKIDNNPLIDLKKEKFNKIYDSGSVYGFVKNSQ